MREWGFCKVFLENIFYLVKLVAMIINGKDIATQIYEDLKNNIANSDTKYSLVAVLVWNNPASLRYISQKQKWADYVGIEFRLDQLDADISESDLLSHIEALNNDSSVTGYIVQLPLPDHIDPTPIINAIDPKKDVDGFHPQNQWKIMTGDSSGFICCTPAGVMDMLTSIQFNPTGKVVTVVGKSNIVGKPLANLLINAWATVTSCDSKTPDISVYTKSSNLIIMATWVPGLLKADMVSAKATIIDVWFTIVENKVFWDADFENLQDKVAAITPVPGWVWALTVANLMKNVIKAKKL